LAQFPRGAAIKGRGQVDLALASRSQVLFVLSGDGLQLGPVVQRIHAAGKLVAVHLDLVDGLAESHAGVRWLARCGADAIISSHGHVVRATRDEGLIAIQRLLVVDDAAIEAGLHAIERARPDIVELLPGITLPHIAHVLLPRLAVPLLAGGFIRTVEDVEAVLAAGALAVTTSSTDLWS
jgi:glycerol uptake operon antiterminator